MTTTTTTTTTKAGFDEILKGLDMLVQQDERHEAKRKLLNKEFEERSKAEDRTAIREAITKLNLKWAEKAVVLLVNEVECTHCGATYFSPAELMIEIDNPSLGLHLRRLKHSPPKHLPKQVKRLHTEVRACTNCFEATEL